MHPNSRLMNLWRGLEKHAVAHVFLIALYIFIVQGPALHGALIEDDTLTIIAFAKEQGPLAAFVGGIAHWSEFYRPFYGLQAWIDYRLFGIDYAGYHIMLIFQLILLTTVIYKLLRMLDVAGVPALLVALIFSAHPFAHVNPDWVIDPIPYNVIVLGFVIALLLKSRRAWQWHAAFAALLLLSPLIRESGLAVNGGVMVYAVAALLSRRESRRQATLLLAEAMLATAAYFSIRLLATSGAETRIHSVGDMAVNLLAYLTKTFFPAFSPAGPDQNYALDPNALASLGFWLIIAAAMMIATYILLGWRAWPPARRYTTLAAGGLAIALSLLAALWLRRTFYFSLYHLAAMGMYGALSLCIFYAARGRARRSARQQTAVLIASGTILANALVHSPYFVDRSLYIGLACWLLLLGVAYQTLSAAHPWGRAMRRVMALLIVAVALLNGHRLHQFLPIYKAGEFNRALCPASLPLDMAMRAAAHYHIELDETFYTCRIDSLGTTIIQNAYDEWLSKEESEP